MLDTSEILIIYNLPMAMMMAILLILNTSYGDSGPNPNQLPSSDTTIPMKCAISYSWGGQSQRPP